MRQTTSQVKKIFSCARASHSSTAWQFHFGSSGEVQLEKPLVLDPLVPRRSEDPLVLDPLDPRRSRDPLLPVPLDPLVPT